MNVAAAAVLSAALFAGAVVYDRNPYYPQFPSQRVCYRQYEDADALWREAVWKREVTGDWNNQRKLDYEARLRFIYCCWAQAADLAHDDDSIREDAADRLRKLIGPRDFDRGLILWPP